MGILSRILGGGAVSAVQGIANIVDQFVETKDEKWDAEKFKLNLIANADIVQAEINKIEAGHRTIFVAGWRPFIGWVCGAGLAWQFLGHPLAVWALTISGSAIVPPTLDTEGLMSLVLALLGLGTIRTVEKLQGKAR